MDATEFRKRGKEMVDYVADYLEKIEKKTGLPRCGTRIPEDPHSRLCTTGS